MKMSTSMSDIGAAIKPGNIGKKIGHVWLRVYHVVFAIFFIVLIIWGGYFWYNNQHVDGWSEEQKDTFVKTRIETSEFKEDRFVRTIGITKMRESIYSNPQSSKQNLFYRNVRPAVKEE